VKQLIHDKMVCFGPHPISGTNILVVQNISSKQSFLKRARNGIVEEEED
jgi:hypothetical protein